MRRRAQANGLGAEVDRAVVGVVRDVMQCDVDRHGWATSGSLFEQSTAPEADQALTTGTGCLGRGRTEPVRLATTVYPWLILAQPSHCRYGSIVMSFLVSLPEDSYR